MDDNPKSRARAGHSQSDMQVFVDEQPCEVTAGCVGEAIAAAAELVQRDGRMIVEVSVDGEKWTEQELSSPEHIRAVVGNVHLTTADPTELVCSTFADAAEALEDADELQREAAELIQADDGRRAMEKLCDALAIWTAVQDAVQKGAALLEVDLHDVKICETTAQESVERLADRLKDMKQAVEMDDPINLSDTLMYELPDVVQQWRAMLRELQFRAQGDNG